MGLPVAVAFGQYGRVIGFDTSKRRVDELSASVDSTAEIPASALLTADILFTTDLEQLRVADFHIIAVPTPINHANTPDLTGIQQASGAIGKILKPGDIVVYESTVYPGVTEEICVPILEESSNLKCGKDFAVGYSPERINPGDKEHTFTNIKKIVAGQDSVTLDIIANTYARVVTAGVYKASSIKVAEAAKVIENTQRDLNIALMNELAVIFERLNIETNEVLQAAETKWNFLPFRPGLVGGHCIGVDPYYLTHKAQLLGYIPQVILAGRRINDNMGRYVARRAIKQFIKLGNSTQHLKVVVLGFTFKENCADIRNSKVMDLVRELQDYNASVYVHDPRANNEEVFNEYGINLTAWDQLPQVDLLIVAVGHDEYRKMKIESLLAKAKPRAVIFDVKSILAKETVDRLGYSLFRL